MLELLFLLLPVAAAYGWYMGHRGTQQAKQQQVDQLAKDYVAGMDLLLNDQQDQAVDLFLDMLKDDSGTVEAHFTLGSLFRSRGEVDRAIRIHQALLESASLSYEQRLLAVQQLGRDYMVAGLYDRAENMLLQLVQEADFRHSALRQLSQIYQATSDWQKAIDVTEKLLKTANSDFSQLLRSEIAHFYCELALQVLRKDDLNRALVLLKKAINADPLSSRTSIMQGRVLIAKNDYNNALQCLLQVPQQDQQLVCEILEMVQECYEKIGDSDGWQQFLQQCVKRNSGASAELLLAESICQQQGAESTQRYLLDRLQRNPTLQVFLRLIEYHIDDAEAGRARESLVLLRELVAKQLQSKPRYRCQKCGFTSARLYWHCPSCRNWSTIKPIRGLDGHQ